jgi:hypothetical protein
MTTTTTTNKAPHCAAIDVNKLRRVFAVVAGLADEIEAMGDDDLEISRHPRQVATELRAHAAELRGLQGAWFEIAEHAPRVDDSILLLVVTFGTGEVFEIDADGARVDVDHDRDQVTVTSRAYNGHALIIGTASDLVSVTTR